MTDVHSHILFGIDDGSSSILESLELISKMKRAGFDKIILTPHYIEGTEYSAENKEKLERYELLKKEIDKNNMGVSIYLGNEIFIHNDILKSLDNDLCFSLNNGKYLLVELPFYNQILELDDIIHEIKIAGYIPIIAHPERYSYFQDNYKLVDEIKNNGVLFQSNYASILGYYGKSAEKLVKYLFKNGYVDYLGTDIHHSNKDYTLVHMDKIIKKIKKITGEEYFMEICNNCSSLVGE